MVETSFGAAVPAHLRFYAAHHKIDAFRFLADTDEPYVGPLDLNMTHNAPTPARSHCARASTLRHQGDEMLLAVAIEPMRARLPVSERRQEAFRHRYQRYLRFRLPIKAFNALT